MNCNLHFVNSFSNFINRERVCHPGDSVKVTIDLHFKQATKVDEVHINVVGTAKTKFMKQTPMGNGKLLSDSCDLINKKIEVLRDAELNMGMHKFRSSFILPPNLPPSFKFRNNATSKLTLWKKTGCTIKYKIQIVIHRPNSPVKKYEYPFEVVRQIDLNEILPSLRKPREVRTTSTNGICKEFSLVASIPQRGYVPGEDIVMSLNVVNNSSVFIKGIEISLIKKIILASIINKEPVEKEEEEWILTEAHDECEEIHPEETREFRKVIKVPQLQPVIDNCELIQVCYRLWIRVKTNEIGKRETLIIPITIGTLGLKDDGYAQEIEEIARKKGNLSLNIPSVNNTVNDVCTCTCSCSHCSRVKVITEGIDIPKRGRISECETIPMTPMSPTNGDGASVFMSFSASSGDDDKK